MKPRRQSAGIALLMTLLVVTLLTILVIEFTDSTQVEAHLTRNSLSLLQARYLARGGVALAELVLKLDLAQKTENPPQRPNVETMLDPWAQPFPPRPIGEAIGEASFRIDDESARFNLNALAARPNVNPAALEARKMLFQGVLSALGLDINLLFPLLDWLDPDDEVSGKSGAEREYYESLKPPYQPRNGRMLNIEELQLVRGFGDLSREQWVALRTMVTVLPTDDLQINVNTAPEPLLTALLTAVDNAAAAKAIVSQRETQPFSDARDLNQIPSWAQMPQAVRSYFTLHSFYFTIHALGTAADVSRGIAVLERRSGLRLEVLDWRDEPATVSLTSPGPSDGMRVFPSMSR
jgi:general secretion pathway protein K